MDDEPLLISLFDGTIHAIRNACTDPKFNLGMGDAEFEFEDAAFVERRDDFATSHRLSRLVRSVMMEAETGPSRFNDVGRISTSLSFGDPDTIVWLHE